MFVSVGVGFPCCGFYPWPYYYPYYYPAPAVYAAPTVYTAPTTYAQPQAPRVQREVVFAEGRYVLSGDGVSTPYQWVWVPNPPAAPPAPPNPPQTAPPTDTPQPR